MPISRSNTEDLYGLGAMSLQRCLKESTLLRPWLAETSARLPLDAQVWVE